MKSRTPICLLLSPSATSCATSSRAWRAGSACECCQHPGRHRDRPRRARAAMPPRDSCADPSRIQHRMPPLPTPAIAILLGSRNNWNRRSPESRAGLRAQHVCRPEQLCGCARAAGVGRIPACSGIPNTGRAGCRPGERPATPRMNHALDGCEVAGHHSRHAEIAEHVLELVEVTRISAQGDALEGEGSGCLQIPLKIAWMD